MKSDPIYQFVKGEEWVTGPNHTIHTSDGYTIRLIERLPKKGERHLAIYKRSLYSSDGTNEGTLLLEKLTEHYSKKALHVFKKRATEKYQQGRYFYVTVEVIGEP